VSKKSVDKKAVIAQIKSMRMEGRSDTEIYAKLSGEYYDRKTVATIITATVTEERKQKYKDAQVTLLVMLGLTIVFKLLMGAALLVNDQNVMTLILAILLPAVNIYLFVKVLQYEASIYRACGFVALMGLTRILNGSAQEAGWAIAVDVLIIALIVGLSYHLDSKLFPLYSPQKMKADANGDFRVE
jgi:hypothetical protein